MGNPSKQFGKKHIRGAPPQTTCPTAEQVYLHLDTSVLVAILIQDALTTRAFGFMNAQTPELMVSDYAAAELASAVARRVRMRELTVEAARQAFATFDGLAPRTIETSPSDIKREETFIRSLDLTLRAPDALNIAIAQRMAATLMTFDEKMAVGARALGVAVAAA